MMPLFKKVLYRLGIWTPRKLHQAVSRFVHVNAPHWPPAQSKPAGHVLVEGHLAESGPNYAFRTGLSARALEETLGLQAHVVFNGFGRRWTTAKRVYGSFGIRSFIFLGSQYLLRNLWWKAKSAATGALILRGLAAPEDILAVKFGGIKVGDLIYDDVLKRCSVKTISRVDRNVWNALRKSYYFYCQYTALFNQRGYRYYISTHSAYSEYGLLCRVALAHGVPVIETTDIQMSCYVDLAESTYHDGIRGSIVRAMESADPEALLLAAEAALKKRLSSEIRQLDAQKAYRGKTFTRDTLCGDLGIPASRKIAFIFAHVFSDAPHISPGMLYADYYRWLASTLEICAAAKDVTWIVKPHPSSDLYGETGAVERMVAALEAPHILLCPKDFNARSLEACADALITVHGTAGLEFAALGIPVILAGRPFYHGFGFTLDPKTVAEYEGALLRVHDMARLTTDQKRRAIQVYGAWEQLFDWHNPIITSDVLANVWGSERPRDIEAAYDLMTHNLQRADPRGIRLWSFTQTVATNAS